MIDKFINRIPEEEFSEVVGDNIINSLEENMNDKFAFLTSNRFWALVIGAISIYLQSKGIIGEAEMILIATITSGFIVVKTVDRNTGDAVVSAGGKTTISMPNDSTVTASTEK
jgi:hypothetical protein